MGRSERFHIKRIHFSFFVPRSSIHKFKMCLSAGTSRFLLILFNIIFFVLGLALIILAIVILVDDDTVMKYLTRLPLNAEVIEEGLYSTSWLTNFGYVLVFAGVFFFVVGGSGLFGACMKVQCLLTVYTTILAMIILLEIAVGVLAIMYADQVEDYLLTFLTSSITKYYIGMSYVDGTITQADDSTGISDGWDLAHVTFKCCGAKNSTDFQDTEKWPGYYTVSGVNVTSAVPATCCKMDDYSKWPNSLDEITFVNITECISNADSYAANTEGCYDSIKNKLKEYATAVAVLAIIVGLVEILG